MNPANEIKKKAKKLGKTYWEYLDGKGFVNDVIHTELQDLEAYQKKCEQKRNGSDNSV